eukprot:Pgem_evm1s17497
MQALAARTGITLSAEELKIALAKKSIMVVTIAVIAVAVAKELLKVKGKFWLINYGELYKEHALDLLSFLAGGAAGNVVGSLAYGASLSYGYSITTCFYLSGAAGFVGGGLVGVGVLLVAKLQAHFFDQMMEKRAAIYKLNYIKGTCYGQVQDMKKNTPVHLVETKAFPNMTRSECFRKCDSLGFAKLKNPAMPCYSSYWEINAFGKKQKIMKENKEKLLALIKEATKSECKFEEVSWGEMYPRFQNQRACVGITKPGDNCNRMFALANWKLNKAYHTQPRLQGIFTKNKNALKQQPCMDGVKLLKEEECLAYFKNRRICTKTKICDHVSGFCQIAFQNL